MSVIAGCGDASIGMLPIGAEDLSEGVDKAIVLVSGAVEFCFVPTETGVAFCDIVWVTSETYGAGGEDARACTILKKGVRIIVGIFDAFIFLFGKDGCIAGWWG